MKSVAYRGPGLLNLLANCQISPRVLNLAILCLDETEELRYVLFQDNTIVKDKSTKQDKSTVI